MTRKKTADDKPTDAKLGKWTPRLATSQSKPGGKSLPSLTLTLPEFLAKHGITEEQARKMPAWALRELIVGRTLRPSMGHADESPAPLPPIILATWREILIALGMKNNREDKDKVSRLSRTYNGPIVFPGQGKQPLVDKAQLIEWWNRLTIELQDRVNQARGATSDARSQHDYGRTGTAVPGIGGGMKHRRRDRKP
jgi:hypothetical protein